MYRPGKLLAKEVASHGIEVAGNGYRALRRRDERSRAVVLGGHSSWANERHARSDGRGMTARIDSATVRIICTGDAMKMTLSNCTPSVAGASPCDVLFAAACNASNV